MKINLHGITMMASVGIYEHEKLTPTKIIISADVTLKTDGFQEKEILDYDIIIATIHKVTVQRHYGYIEDLAYSLQHSIMALNTNVQRVGIKVQKCIKEGILQEISVEV